MLHDRVHSRPSSLLLVALLGFTASGLQLDAAPWLVFSEVHYSPPQGTQLEFLEITNPEAPRVDLSGWRLEGAIELEFPAGLFLAAGGTLVVAKDPHALQASYPRAGLIVGPFRGELPDDGGRIVLRNRFGARVARMRYGCGGEWTSIPDGTGHSLVLQQPFLDATRAGSWNASPQRSGSPGWLERPVRPPRGEMLVAKGQTWKFFRGFRAAPKDWAAPDFDDGNWESGPSGFGFADGRSEEHTSELQSPT